MLLRNYLDAGNRERLYDEASHLFEAADYDDDLAGAWLLGADARQLLAPRPGAPRAAFVRASALLAGNDPEGPVQLAADMDTLDLQHAVDMLGAFRSGLDGARSATGA